MHDIDQIFTRLDKLFSNPKTELVYSNDFTLLISILLSAQSTDKSVNKATKELFAIADDPIKMLAIGEENLKNYIKTIGLYNSKAKNIIALSNILLEKYQGIIPDNFDQLITLPGVGRKTAQVYLNCAHDYPVIAVDTHVFRVSNRIGIIKSKNVLDAERKLNQIIDDKWKKQAHNLLIFQGRYSCVARKPKCTSCVINDLCDFAKK